jgi:hypothetical protein
MEYWSIGNSISGRVRVESWRKMFAEYFLLKSGNRHDV